MRTAIRFRDEALTYRELNVRVNQLARYLVELGAGPDTLVAICMERSLEMVVALYAILKSGSAYVPIDPEYPADRISFMLGDTAAPILLTQGALAGRFRGATARVIPVDLASRELADRTATRSLVRGSLDDLAYVIYTSGSTGQPKGAMITHRAIANRILWMQEAYGLTPDDRVLQKTPFSFDVSVWEFFWPLLFGAELVIAEPGGHRDSAYLTQIIVERGITTIHFVPSMLQLFLEDPRASSCTSLRRVICSGEALPKALQDRFFARLDAELHNLYGPTEAAVDVTAWACDPHSTLSFVPIGKPIANTQMYILDAEMQPVPVGTDGELYIGGVQVARGYLNRPELTAERFVDDPFSDSPGGTALQDRRPGSLPAGREHRVPGPQRLPGQDPGLPRRARRDRGGPGVDHWRPPGRRRRPRTLERRPGAGRLRLESRRRHGAGRGPAGSPAGAAARVHGPDDLHRDRAVPADPQRQGRPQGTARRRFASARSSARPFVAPRTQLESLVAEKWRQLLDIDRVGVHDRFFELGGTSLQAARFVNEMQAELDESIFVVTLFAAPSVAEYAAFLEAQYPAAVARLVGAGPLVIEPSSSPAPITEADLARFRSAVPTTPWDRDGRAANGTPRPSSS